MRKTPKILIHEVNVHIGAPAPVAEEAKQHGWRPRGDDHASVEPADPGALDVFDCDLDLETEDDSNAIGASEVDEMTGDESGWMDFDASSPTPEELQAAFSGLSMPRGFAGLSDFWWRAFSQVCSEVAGGTLEPCVAARTAVNCLSATLDDSYATGGLSYPFELKLELEQSLADKPLSMAALAMLGCKTPDELDRVLTAASGALASVKIAEHASRMRTKPEIMAKFLEALHAILRADPRAATAAAEWWQILLRVEGLEEKSHAFYAKFAEGGFVEPTMADMAPHEGVIATPLRALEPDEEAFVERWGWSIWTIRNAINAGAFVFGPGPGSFGPEVNAG